MKETKETKKSRNITFRLTDEEYAQVEKAAASAGDDPNNWCRKAAVSQLSEGHTFTHKRAPDIPGNRFVALSPWLPIQAGFWPKRSDGCNMEKPRRPEIG
jgi:hypothetical protein